jgi:2-succinyl-5-enolpyruvyl-6-hydroxy-3-cyclohexene-1-carboxylate synthase
LTSGANVQATFCATLVDEWIRCGLTHAVVAPGSRSTPLALALATSAIELVVHHDERSAAFTALGLGLSSGRPAVLLCTSGTAAAELHPAVIEASLSRVPMLVCTADRPPELQSVGAPQTIDQTHLFGRAPRWFAEPGVADEATAASWRSLAARAVAEATGSRPGPVHLNLAFREPLVGEAGPLPAARAEGGWHRTSSSPGVPVTVVPAGRGVLVAGGAIADPAGVADLSARLGWPVLADPRSGCRVPGAIAAFDALLRVPAFAGANRPDVVVRLGEPPASKVLNGWLAQVPQQMAVEATGTWFDPERTAAELVTAEPGAWCRSATGSPAPSDWLATWQAADAAAQQVYDERLAELSEPAVARAVFAAARGTIVVASSMPVRDLEWYAGHRRDVRVLANRGANGIDGVVSTGVGVALAGGAVTVLVGDVAFLHDSNALLGLADRGVDLCVVVVDNRGGGIFSFLPQAQLLAPARFEQLFGTPHSVDLVGLGRAHGVTAAEASSLDDLRAVLAGSGPRLVVVRTDRATNVTLHDALNQAVAAAL